MRGYAYNVWDNSLGPIIDICSVADSLYLVTVISDILCIPWCRNHAKTSWTYLRN